MTTRFPSFSSETQQDLWFTDSKTTDEVAKLEAEEEKYKKFVESIVDKDKGIPYIGASTCSDNNSAGTDEESDEDSDESNEQMGDDDVNGLPDSPDEQILPELDSVDLVIEGDNPWMNV